MNLLKGRGKNIWYSSSFDLGWIYFSTKSALSGLHLIAGFICSIYSRFFLYHLVSECETDFLIIWCIRNVLGQTAGAIPQAVTVTPEEREAIERVGYLFVLFSLHQIKFYVNAIIDGLL